MSRGLKHRLPPRSPERGSSRFRRRRRRHLPEARPQDGRGQAGDGLSPGRLPRGQGRHLQQRRLPGRHHRCPRQIRRNRPARGSRPLGARHRGAGLRTNEGFDAKLDPVAYRDRYLSAIREIRAALPKARLVMIGPPQGERPLPAASPPRASPACRRHRPWITRRPPTGREPVRNDRRSSTRCAQCNAYRRGRTNPFLGLVGDHAGGLRRIPLGGRGSGADGEGPRPFHEGGLSEGGESFAAFIEPEVRAAFRGEDAVSND